MAAPGSSIGALGRAGVSPVTRLPVGLSIGRPAVANRNDSWPRPGAGHRPGQDEPPTVIDFPKPSPGPTPITGKPRPKHRDNADETGCDIGMLQIGCMLEPTPDCSHCPGGKGYKQCYFDIAECQITDVECVCSEETGSPDPPDKPKEPAEYF